MATATEKATTPLPNGTAAAPEGATIKVRAWTGGELKRPKRGGKTRTPGRFDQTVERAMTGGTTLLVEAGPDAEARKKIVNDLRKSATFLKIGLDVYTVDEGIVFKTRAKRQTTTPEVEVVAAS